MVFFLGLDFGTSGTRTAVLDETGQQVFDSRAVYADPANPQHWREALFDLIGGLPAEIRSGLSALAIDGTSGTLLVTNSRLEPISPALLYNDGRAVLAAAVIAKAFSPSPLPLSHQGRGELETPLIKGVARSAGGFSEESKSPQPPFNKGGLDYPLDKGGGELASRGIQYSKQNPPCPSLTREELNPYGPTSGLAKRLWLAKHFPDAAFCFHQADWLAALLTGKPGITDYHNALKSGYDVGSLAWPDWVTALPGGHWQQQVMSPGEAIGTVSPEIAKRFTLNPACVVRAGTTDSIAAFIASGASQPGEAVTSLGTTLVLKLLSETRVEDPASGVYSHRFGRLWLAGGASNTGGGVLKQFFSDEELARLSATIVPDTPSGLDYYPLLKPGERFPINDPNLAPRLEPRPRDEEAFLRGLLESIARIEALGYKKLKELGANPLTRVISAGSGAKNETWRRIRERLLGVPVSAAMHSEAAIGAAQLARLGSTLLPR